jgi:3-methyladenine DNA glycosylase Tag
VSAFAKIRARALERLGAEELERRLPHPRSEAELRATPDDRYLSLISLRIFRAGLKHSVVDAKWPGFETVFFGFAPRRVAQLPDEAMEKLMGDERLIRHWGKLKSVRDNAAAILRLAEEKGGMGAYLAGWPGSDVVGLWDDIGKRFAQMGGNSAPMFLRMVGKDTFVLSDGVVKALQHWGVTEAPLKGKKDRAAVQAQFNRWAEETGLPLCQLSMTLAGSVD